MHQLKVVHKNLKVIQRDQDAAFQQWANELLEETLRLDKLKAEKKYKVKLDHVK